MRKLVVVLVAMSGLALLVTPAAAQGSDNVVYGWGKYLSPTGTLVPLGGTPGPSGVVQMVTTNTDTYVLDSNNVVWAAGDNAEGQLGIGNTSPPTTTTTYYRVKKLPAIQSLALVGPNATMMAIATNGDVWGWGLNSYGQLCASDQTIDQTIPYNNSSTTVDKPVDLTTNGYLPGNMTMAAGAGDHATYYKAVKNKLISCGANHFGDLGNGTDPPTGPTGPVTVTGITDSSPVVSMTASWSDEGVLLSDGAFWAWGFNGYGSLGYPTTSTYDDNGTSYGYSSSPNPVPLPYPATVPANPLVDNTVTMGGGGPTDSQTMALLNTGTNDNAFSWGSDNDGQLCDGMQTNEPAPVQLSLEIDTGQNMQQNIGPLAEVASGGETGYLLNQSGELYACGDNTYGEIGDPTNQSSPILSPTQVFVNSVNDFSQVSSTNFVVSAVGG